MLCCAVQSHVIRQYRRLHGSLNKLSDAQHFILLYTVSRSPPPCPFPPLLQCLLKSITAAHSNNVSVIEYSIKAIISNSLHSIIFGKTENPIAKPWAASQTFRIRTIKFVCKGGSVTVCVRACNVFNGTFAIPKMDDRFFGRRFCHDGWRLNDWMCNSRKPFWESIIRFMYTCFFSAAVERTDINTPHEIMCQISCLII